MKYAIMSDVHANPGALQLALRDARKRGCERYVMLGDVTGYGYDVTSAVSTTKEKFDVVVLGNHDSACVGLEPGLEVLLNEHYDMDRDQREELSSSDVDWMRSLPVKHEIGDFVCVHGDLVNPKSWGYILGCEDAARNFFRFTERILFCGHSHHAAIWELSSNGLIQEKLTERLSRPATKVESVSFRLTKGSRYIVNVGSVGYPRNDLCCVYGVYDDADRRITLRRFPFDFMGYINAMQAKDLILPKWISELLERAHKVANMRTSIQEKLFGE